MDEVFMDQLIPHALDELKAADAPRESALETKLETVLR
jgi:hypothetical protein